MTKIAFFLQNINILETGIIAQTIIDKTRDFFVFVFQPIIILKVAFCSLSNFIESCWRKNSKLFKT